MTDVEELTPWQHMANARLTTLEAARRRHSEKISDHGGLLTAMDHDVTNAQVAFRAQLSVLNALRATQNEQAERLTGVETRLTGVETRLTGVESRLTGVESRLTGVETTLQKVHVGVDRILLLLDRADQGEGSSSGSPS
jgi:chromosome segregation ATPase